MEMVTSLNDSNSNLHFYIGVLRTISGSAKEAIQNFVNAIEKSDDNYYAHYFWKGVALAAAGCYDLALGELEIAKNIDKSSLEVSLHIGVCYLIVGDLDNAYEAFKAVVGNPKYEMEVNFCIGKFFMSRGFMSHAIQSFQFALKNSAAEKVLQELLKCYIHEKNLVNAMDVLKNLENLESKLKAQYAFDMSALESLKLCCEEKVEEALTLLSSIDQSKKEGYIFKRKDLACYISFMQFLSGDYQKALKNMTVMEMDNYGKSDNALLPTDEEDAFNILFVEAVDREGQFYVSTKSLTHPELVYNMALCHLMLKNVDKAYLKLALLACLPQISLKVFRLMAKLRRHVSADTLSKAKTICGKFQPNNSLISGEEEEMANQFLLDSSGKLSDDPELCPFPVENRLCSIYPGRALQLNLEEDLELLELRFSFCLPIIKLSDIKVETGHEELLKISLRSIEFKPEAPWIKKLDEQIVFTNHVVDDEVVEFSSPSAVLERLKLKNTIPVNTQVKLNVEHAYQSNIDAQRAAFLRSKDDVDRGSSFDEHDIEEDEGEEEQPEKPDLAKLKRELMLDERTNQLLSKLKK